MTALIISLFLLGSPQGNAPLVTSPGIERAGQVPVLSEIPLINTLFQTQKPAVEEVQGVPFLKDLPIVGRMFVAQPPVTPRWLPFLQDLPIL